MSRVAQVLEGDGVTINPGGDESAAMVVPLQPGAGIPAPMSAPPFAKHTLVNSGTVPLKMVYARQTPGSDRRASLAPAHARDRLPFRERLYGAGPLQRSM